MIKFVLRSDKEVGTIRLDGDYTAERVLAIMQTNEPDANWVECEKVPRGKHVCKYCGSVANDANADLLCDSCKELFGHSLVSEL